MSSEGTTLTRCSLSCRSCYMVFPSLQLALALSCVMGLVMFARYCGEDHSDKLGSSPRDAVSFSACFPPLFYSHNQQSSALGKYNVLFLYLL